MLRLLKWSCAFSTKLRRSTSCGTCTTTKKRHFSHFAAFRGGHMTGVANLSKMPSFLTKVFCIPFRTAYAMAALRFARKVGMKRYFCDPLQGGVVSANCAIAKPARHRVSQMLFHVFFSRLWQPFALLTQLFFCISQPKSFFTRVHSKEHGNAEGMKVRRASFSPRPNKTLFLVFGEKAGLVIIATWQILSQG